MFHSFIKSSHHNHLQKKNQIKIQALYFVLNYIQPLALNIAVKFKTNVVNSSINSFTESSEINFDENL